jgi:hypothetical protein
MWAQKLMWIVWPAFLSACVLELVVFAVVDPLELRWAGQDLAWPRQGVYTGAFFVFWAVSLLSGALTSLLRMAHPKPGDCPFTEGERPEGCPQR